MYNTIVEQVQPVGSRLAADTWSRYWHTTFHYYYYYQHVNITPIELDASVWGGRRNLWDQIIGNDQRVDESFKLNLEESYLDVFYKG